ARKTFIVGSSIVWSGLLCRHCPSWLGKFFNGWRSTCASPRYDQALTRTPAATIATNKTPKRTADDLFILFLPPAPPSLTLLLSRAHATFVLRDHPGPSRPLSSA